MSVIGADRELDWYGFSRSDRAFSLPWWEHVVTLVSFKLCLDSGVGCWIFDALLSCETAKDLRARFTLIRA